MSKIEVNEIDAQSGSTITVGSACKSVAVPGNVVKTNAIQASDAGNIISQSGTTITLGASGDTISLASGASQSGFGRTGTVDWQTGSIKTSTFTAANGEGYFANTSGGAFTMNLPAGTAGNIVSVVDYTNTFQTNALTVAPNGSQKIGGIAASIDLTTEGQSVTLVYVDDTEGWKNVQDSTSNVTGNPFLVATGGTITTSGNCKIHTFTGPGTFTVSAVSQTAPENIVSYMVIAGGGGSAGICGGGNAVGGGGAGGFRELKNPVTPYTASPLDGYPTAPNRVTVTAAAFPITVGAGGTGGPKSAPSRGGNGNPSIFSTITSAGGGAGGNDSPREGGTGGSGGGTGGGNCSSGVRAAGNTPPVSPPQGNPGGSSPGGPPDTGSGGGGGASAAGSDAAGVGGNGGVGVDSSITNVSTGYGGGGGGGAGNPQNTAGTGTKGGGAGGTNNQSGTAGTANTGGGAGGSGLGNNNVGQAGGSGIVVIRYKFQ